LVAFIAAISLQVVILIAVPARKAITLATGKTVVLKVQPVDPYSILGGYYVTLGFDISGRANFASTETFENEDQVYAVVEEGPDGIWIPVGLERILPTNLPENRRALAGRFRDGQIRYGIEDFYIAETQREAIAEDLRKNVDKARVEVRVDRTGNAALKRLIIEDRVYE
jgi:uncharacterized membrane-anchored protein